MYQLIKPILFKFDPENVHYFVTRNLKRFNRFPGGASLSKALWDVKDSKLEREVFEFKFRNPVGLAAGFDKNAEMMGEMANLGFGFVEIGTVTPLPQPGNDKPRMFRLPADSALTSRWRKESGNVLAWTRAAPRASRVRNDTCSRVKRCRSSASASSTLNPAASHATGNGASTGTITS